MTPTPPPFGDPTSVRADNTRAITKGIGIGCGSCLVIIIGIVGFAAAIVAFVFHTLKQSDAAQEGLNRARQSPAVVAVLGEPINLGWIVTGSIKSNNGRTTADIVVPLSGPKGSGSLRLVGASADSGTWNFSVLSFNASESAQHIDLLRTNAEAPEAKP